jgi:hypothetical protein
MKEEKKDGKNKIKYIFSFYNFSEIPSFSSLIIYLLTFLKKRVYYIDSQFIYIYTATSRFAWQWLVVTNDFSSSAGTFFLI